MNNEQTPQTDLSDMSLADYRAQRENPASAEPKDVQEDAPVGDPAPESLDESAAEEGAAEETTEHTEEEKKPAKRGGWQRKLEKAEREIEALKAQLAKPADTAPKQEESAPEGPKFDRVKPRLEDFDSIEQFAEALTDFKLQEKDFQRQQQEAQAKAQEEATKLVEGWNQRQAEAKKTHSDYDDVIEAASDIPLSPAHQRLFLESELGAEIAYQLAADKKKLEAFANSNPLAAARMFGKLEAALASDDAPHKETKVSNAPRPIRPIAGRTPAPAASFDPTKASLAEYRRWRERTGRA